MLIIIMLVNYENSADCQEIYHLIGYHNINEWITTHTEDTKNKSKNKN